MSLEVLFGVIIACKDMERVGIDEDVTSDWEVRGRDEVLTVPSVLVFASFKELALIEA